MRACGYCKGKGCGNCNYSGVLGAPANVQAQVRATTRQCPYCKGKKFRCGNCNYTGRLQT